MKSKEISLFYWSSKVFEHKMLENYGDLLSPYIVEQLAKRPVQFFNAPRQEKRLFKKSYLMAIGSIMSYTGKKASVWGSGIISREDTFSNAQFCAVRGPLSRKRIQELGYECPEVYGDPAILLPDLYNPSVTKKYTYGFIPHYVDYKKVFELYGQEENTTVIDLMTDSIFKTTDAILSCDKVISSSLHGVIVAQAYGIPAIWVRFSDKLSGDNVKYEDYFRSVNITPYDGILIDQYKDMSFYEAQMKKVDVQVSETRLSTIKEKLKIAFPIV